MLGSMNWFPGWNGGDGTQSPTPGALSPKGSRHGSKEDDDDDTDTLLTQFPPYGSQARPGGSSPDWTLLGYPSASDPNNTTTPPPTMMVDNEEMLDETARLNNAPAQHKDGTTGQPNPAMGTSSGSSPTSTRAAAAFLDWDATEQGLWKNQEKAIATANPLTVTTATSDNNNGDASATLSSLVHPGPLYMNTAFGEQTQAIVAGAGDRQHWMPDQYCKQCYSCDTTFTVFRRRHHCRICGQVFCNPCSAYFLPMVAPARYSRPGVLVAAANASKASTATTPNSSGTGTGTNTTTTVRVCRACHQQFQQQQKQQQIQQQQQQQQPQSVLPTTPTASTSLHKSFSRTPSSPDPAATSTTITATNTPSLSQPQRPTPTKIQAQLSTAGEETPTVPTPKTQNVIQEVLMQQQPAAVATAMDSMWQSISQKSLLFMPDLPGMTTVVAPQTDVKESRGTDEENDNSEEDQPNDADMSTTTTSLPARPLWFPLQRGTSLQGGGSIAASITTATENQVDSNAISATGEVPVHPVPLADAVRAAESSVQSQTAKEGRRQLGLGAAHHLSALCQNLLDEYAPQLAKNSQAQWKHHLLTLATRCCATVEPNVKNGDLIDIRPYCKIKTISGGSVDDCAYLSGVVFTKSVVHKNMAKELSNPRIMLLSGSIEFTRHENQIASLETLFEQEQKYTEILVGKILKLKPDILMVGRFVSRQAHELLLAAGIVLIQQVKPNLLSRIARQTGATIISSTDHIMNQFGADALGKCHRFRLVTFRDNEVWSDTKDLQRRFVTGVLKRPSLKNYERQAALAAEKLGENVIDGAEAVRAGLAKRGVAQTYVMLEGCPKNLGCTIILRGADREALKQVKTVLRFLIMAAYNLRLETCYLKERCARIRPGFVETPNYGLSTSLCVDFGSDPEGRNSHPWNGGTTEPPPPSKTGAVTAFDHQSILITSVWMTQKSQCCPAEVKGICYYSLQDVTLGQFLRDSCFNLSLKCQNPNCKKSVLDHSLSFVHNDGLINILVEEMAEELPPPEEKIKKQNQVGSDARIQSDDEGGEPDRPIATWTYCCKCEKLVAPLTYVSEQTWRLSFGKFLETSFYNRDAIMNTSEEVGCSCDLQTSAILFFGCGKLAARFSYEPVRPYDVFARRYLPIEMSYHKNQALRKLDVILKASTELFVRFNRHIDRMSREARSLFHSAVNRPENVQTVFSELNQIGAEVDHVSRVLQEKVTSAIEEYRHQDETAVSEDLLRFPWIARRYLFMFTSAWNEKLSAAGQAISAMRKIASTTSSRNEGIGPAVVGDIHNEELLDSMNRLRLLKERYASYNVTDINQALPSLYSGAQQQPDEYDDDFEDAESPIDFANGVDADVLASRRRLQGGKAPVDRRTKIASTKPPPSNKRNTNDPGRNSETDMTSSSAPKPTPGGAVKSALNRFFNRGGREQDDYVVNLGIFAEGRPRLEPGANGIVLPVFDEQWSSIIAYSLASSDYASQFKHYAKLEGVSPEPTSDTDQSKPPYGGVPKDTASDPSRERVRSVERRMLIRNKTHIKHTFRDFDEKGQATCKFVCTSYWATQFQAVREVFLSPNAEGDEGTPTSGADIEHNYLESLSSAATWAASGGKSGASFSRTSDHRFVIKCISRTELQMFLDCAPAYFEYLSKAFFHGLPTVLCKIVGIYEIGVHNRVTGKRTMEQVAIMQNIFYNRKITKVFDLKGSLRGRFARNVRTAREDESDSMTDPSGNKKPTPGPDDMDNGVLDNAADLGSDRGMNSGAPEKGPTTLLDGDFLDFTNGRPMPMTDRANAVFQMSILNDTLFLSIINVLDYSILVGVDEERRELVVGIIDFMRQYDILKQMERVGKSLPMVVGSEAPTIIQPPLYKARFTNAMERYFMSVPSKWTVV